MSPRDSADLLELARQRVQSRELPSAATEPTLFAVTGSENRCSLCRSKISAKETSYEVEVREEPHAKVQTLHFHIACQEAWMFACGEGASRN
jgi:hypothetical protein